MEKIRISSVKQADMRIRDFDESTTPEITAAVAKKGRCNSGEHQDGLAGNGIGLGEMPTGHRQQDSQRGAHHTWLIPM